MGQSNVAILQLIKIFVAAILASIVVSGCDGDDGRDAVASSNQASSLGITINRVTVSSPPVVNFSVTNEDGVAFGGLSTDDLRFTVAKLAGGSWQNYINSEETATVGPGSGNTAIQATRENDGTLVYHPATGEYTYTFATDITNVTEPLTVAYDPSLTHRVAIQTRGSLPMVNAVYTFRPSDGATEGIATRKIVKTESCNECHNKLELHDARIEVDYCVTCHNPGSTDANSGNTVDFKVMIHKIHRGAELTVVQGPDGETFQDYGTGADETADNGEYAIYGYNNSKHDYSTVGYPQDIRNCTKCHDGSDEDTPDGDNWKTQSSMAACGSCHDDVDFAAGTNHAGGSVSDDSSCSTCHVDGGDAGSVADSHFLPEPVARQKFKINILQICGEDVGTDPGPECVPGSTPSVQFSVTDPTNGDAEYNLTTTPEIANGDLSFLVAWNTNDYNNIDGTGDRPARADSIGFTENAVDDTPTRRTVTASFIIPIDGDAIGPNNYRASGSGAIGAQGPLAGDFDGDGNRTRGERIFVKNEVEFFRINDTKVQERRATVDNDKCNQCHDQVSFHGGNRSGEYGVCVLCHNPNNTDIAARNDPGATLPGPDNKTEESVNFRTMVHAIHAGAQTNFDGSEAHGIREQGLVVFGHNGSTHDYSHTRFPGIINDCETCHVEEGYWLDGRWTLPTTNNLLSTTVTTDAGADPNWEDPDDDLNITPTASICSSCHDDAATKTHMTSLGGAVYDATQTTIVGSNDETCSVCHGPGSIADVETVHAAE